MEQAQEEKKPGKNMLWGGRFTGSCTHTLDSSRLSAGCVGGFFVFLCVLGRERMMMAD